MAVEQQRPNQPLIGPLIERRLHRRYQPRRKLACEAELPTGGTVRGEVQDLSAGGLSFLCSRGWKQGDMVRVRMLSPAGTFSLSAELRVLRSARLRTGDWFVAGAFQVPLGPTEMAPFLIDG
jgi:hypothetical protein